MIVLIKEFKESEFACKCGKCGLGYEDMDESLLSKLFTARKESGVSFILSSAIRCEQHNEDEGGSSTSAHLRGMAVDIRFTSNVDLLHKLKYLLKVGFKRVGINFKLRFIHVDVDPDLPQGMFQYK